VANPLPLVALAGDNLALVASSFSIGDEDPDYPADNLAEANPAKPAKSTALSASVSIVTPAATIVAAALFNTNATQAAIAAGGPAEFFAIPDLDLDGQRVDPWLDLRASPLGPATTWSIGLEADDPVVIGQIALLVALHPLNLKYGLRRGRKRPGDVEHVTRSGTVLRSGANIRTWWARGLADLEEDETLHRNLEASAKGSLIPFVFIPDENTNEAWFGRFASNDFEIGLSNYSLREFPFQFDQMSSGPPNG
jgi:hypothetical protein